MPDVPRTSYGPPVEGTQSITRAVAVLRYVAQTGEEGTRAADVASALNLNLVTARRFLQALVAEGLLLFDAKQRTYLVGAGLISLAASASLGFAHRERFMPALTAIAEAIKDTTYLMIRRGNHAVCLARVEGAFPIRVMSLDVGSVRPLGISSGSLALFAFLPAEERARIASDLAAEYGTFGHTKDQVEELAANARSLGYAFNPGLIINGVFGVGFPIFEGNDVVASISVAAIAQRLGPDRLPDVVDAVRRAVSSIAHASVDTPSAARFARP